MIKKIILIGALIIGAYQFLNYIFSPNTLYNVSTPIVLVERKI